MTTENEKKASPNVFTAETDCGPKLSFKLLKMMAVTECHDEESEYVTARDILTLPVSRKCD